MRASLLALLLATSLARAGEPVTTAPAPARNGADLSFDLFADEKKPPPKDQSAVDKRIAELAKKVKLRRRMLQAHQALGFATLALLAATAVLGQLNYDDKFASSGDYTQRFDTPHYALSIAATTAFAATGALALFAPNPYAKPIKRDTALLHKVAMALATACFVTDIVLGPIGAQLNPGKLTQRPLAQTHLAVGYGAFGFMSIGTLAYVF